MTGVSASDMQKYSDYATAKAKEMAAAMQPK